MAPSIFDSNRKKIAWPRATGAKTDGTNGKYGRSSQPSGRQMIVQYSSGNANGRGPIPKIAATNQNTQIANSLSCSLRRDGTESNGKAFRKAGTGTPPA